jgi:hypothetical protein
MIFSLVKSNPSDTQKSIRLLELVQSFHFTTPSIGYTFVFKAFHKALKETNQYLQFADWWNLQNFMPEDYQKEMMPNGKEMMSIAEQAYIAYSKHLLPKQSPIGEMVFDKDKALSFLPVLAGIIDSHPQFLYPAYYYAKLLLALGDKDNILDSILPFARKKRNDFWVWDILAEAVSDDPEKVFACYCKALTCKSPEEMLVNLRQRMAALLISKHLFNEAKGEIEHLVKARTEQGYKIPNQITNWQEQAWYKTAVAQHSNDQFYKKYTASAESILFSDTPEETVIVEFVNSDKKILNFIASENKFGFFKYDRFLRDVSIGDTLKVRFQGGSNEGMHQVYTVAKVNDTEFKSDFQIDVGGEINIPHGKPFGFINNIFIHPSLVSKMNLKDGMSIEGKAIKSYNKEKKQWGWKVFEIKILTNPFKKA